MAGETEAVGRTRVEELELENKALRAALRRHKRASTLWSAEVTRLKKQLSRR